jgi:hypothetical protein
MHEDPNKVDLRWWHRLFPMPPPKEVLKCPDQYRRWMIFNLLRVACLVVVALILTHVLNLYTAAAMGAARWITKLIG